MRARQLRQPINIHAAERKPEAAWDGRERARPLALLLLLLMPLPPPPPPLHKAGDEHPITSLFFTVLPKPHLFPAVRLHALVTCNGPAMFSPAL